MGFSAFKSRYLEKIDNGGFSSTEETAEFIADTYDLAINGLTGIKTTYYEVGDVIPTGDENYEAGFVVDEVDVYIKEEETLPLILVAGGGKTVLKAALTLAFSRQMPPADLEAEIAKSLVLYWTLVVLAVPPGATTSPAGASPGGSPGSSSISGNLPAVAESTEDFVDGLIGIFEEHLSGLKFGNAVVTSPPWVILQGPTNPFGIIP